MKQVSLRPVTAADEPLLLELYALSRAAELALVPWNEAQRDYFVRLQLTAQTNFYQQEYPDAVHSIVLYENTEIGRLYVHRRPHEIRILDFMLLEHPQAAAIGEEIIATLKEEARAASLPLNIHLESFNAMQPLFAQGGFVRLTDDGVRALYEWQAV